MFPIRLIRLRSIGIGLALPIRDVSTFLAIGYLALRIDSPTLLAMSLPLGVLLWELPAACRGWARRHLLLQRVAQSEVPEWLLTIFNEVLLVAPDVFPRKLAGHRRLLLGLHHSDEGPVFVRHSSRQGFILCPKQQLSRFGPHAWTFILAHEVAHFALRNT